MLGTRNPNHRNFNVEEKLPLEEIVEELTEVPEEKPAKFVVTETLLYEMTKSEQEAKLKEHGLKKSEIKKLRKETDRVSMLKKLLNI